MAEDYRTVLAEMVAIARDAGWDREILAIEVQALIDLDFDVMLTGFSLAEVDLTSTRHGKRQLRAPLGQKTPYQGLRRRP